MTKKQLEDLQDNVDALMEKLVNDQFTDITLLTLVDRVARRTLYDVHPAWITWSYYVQQNLCNGSSEQRRVAYYCWAKDNCKPLKRTVK